MVDLLVKECPVSCTNFLKLCKAKYYNFSQFTTILQNRLCYTGSRGSSTSTKQSDHDSSAWGLVPSATGKRVFLPEMQTPKVAESNADRSFKHKGTLAWVTKSAESGSREISKERGSVLADSKFCISLKDNVGGYETEMAIFGHVVEGQDDALNKINDAILDIKSKPIRPVLILHTHVLEDPFDDIPGLQIPDASPEPNVEQFELIEELSEAMEKGAKDIGDDGEEDDQKRRQVREAASNALTLEIVGDLPFAEVLPEENVLFVCKLNPVTQDDDLELIFSRFGAIRSCEIVRDPKTGDSLQYAFVEFENKEDCERAYFKMDGVVIDDRRIHVDFSQSVSNISKSWREQTNNKRKKAHGSKFVSKTGRDQGSRDERSSRSRSPRGRSENRRDERDRRDDRYKRDDRNRRSDRYRDRDRDQDRRSRDRDRDRYDDRSRRYGRDDRERTRDDRDRRERSGHKDRDRRR